MPKLSEIFEQAYQSARVMSAKQIEIDPADVADLKAMQQELACPFIFYPNEKQPGGGVERKHRSLDDRRRLSVLEKLLRVIEPGTLEVRKV